LRLKVVFCAALLLIVGAATLLSACGAGSSLAGEPPGAEKRQGFDRFIGSWEPPSTKVPNLYIEKTNDRFLVSILRPDGTVLFGPSAAQGSGSDLIFAFANAGQPTIRLRLHDRGHIVVTGPGVSPRWHVNSMTMRRFSYGP
jgi:hypothetical protein